MNTLNGQLDLQTLANLDVLCRVLETTPPKCFPVSDFSQFE